jgi:uncharacterized protein
MIAGWSVGNQGESMRWAQMFFVLFHTIYFAMNLYVFWRLLGYFGIRQPIVLWPLVTAGMFSLTMGTMLYYRLGVAFYPVYCAMTMWFGILWLLFWCLLVLEPFRPLLRGVNPARIGTVVVAVVGILTAYAVYHAQHPRVVVERIAAPVKLRLVQISDLHIGSTRPGYTRRVVEEITSLKPDAVLATGDILDWPGPISSEGLAILGGIRAPLFAVTGNHEGYAGKERCVAALKAAGFTVLRGDSVDLKGIRLYGFDDDSKEGALAKDLAGVNIDPAAFNVVMFHHPRGFPEAAKAGVKLMLSGHTHHGQIFPFNIVIDYWYEYPYGLHTIGDSKLYTSQGTGTWGPRMRLGTDGEITVFELGPEAAKP